MEKRIVIEGMSCAHCTGRVEKALNAMEGVTAKVDLQGADVRLAGPVTDAALKAQVEDSGYTVTEIR